MEMTTFKALAAKLSPNIAIRIRGRHGIGKSQAVYQIAESLGLKVVERRLSQMTEGDIIGLPIISSDSGSTVYKPCDWLVECCTHARLLFLDELNRALPGVEQATFQLADSRKFYGYELHPETRIIIAENIGDQYQVQASDPAAISRYAIIDLEPTVEEWLAFANEHCSVELVEFIRTNPHLLDFTGTCENNAKYYDRRAWHRLDQELDRTGLLEDPANPLFYAMCLAMVGPEAGISFTKFCQTRDRQVSAADVLTDWEKAKKKMGKETNEKYIELVGKLEDYFKKFKDDETLTDEQTIQMAKFIHDCPAEPVMACWVALNVNQATLLKVHPHVAPLIVKVASGLSISADGTILEKSEEKK